MELKKDRKRNRLFQYGHLFSPPSKLLMKYFITVLFALLFLPGGFIYGIYFSAAGRNECCALAPGASQSSLLLDAVCVDDFLATVGERGHILISKDCGCSWRQVEVPTCATLTGVFFHDKKLGWAVGHDAIILRTTDGGESWKKMFYAPQWEQPLLDVWFKDATTGIAIGAYGLYMSTSDGGSTWSRRAISEDDYHYNHICETENGRLYIMAEAGNIYRSEDAGEKWKPLPSPYMGSFFGALPIKADTLLIYGLRGHLFRSEDAGLSWREIPTGTVAMLTDAQRTVDGRILVAGLEGTLLESRDGGCTFTSIDQSHRRGISKILLLGGKQVVAFGENGINHPGTTIGFQKSIEY